MLQNYKSKIKTTDFIAALFIVFHIPKYNQIWFDYKASANKIAILKFAIQALQHLMYLGWTSVTEFFSAQKFVLSMLNVGVYELQFYSPTPLMYLLYFCRENVSVKDSVQIK